MCSIDRLCPVMDNGQNCCQPADCTFCMYYYENNSDELEKCKGCKINLNLEEKCRLKKFIEMVCLLKSKSLRKIKE